jgi:hypothetical protein
MSGQNSSQIEVQIKSSLDEFKISNPEQYISNKQFTNT